MLLHRGTLISRALLAAASIAVLSLTGCGAVLAGDHDATTWFTAAPRNDGTFFGWSEITVGQDVSSVKGASLVFARFELPDDSPVTDLSFIQSVQGWLVIKDGDSYLEKQPAGDQNNFPAGENIVPLDNLYDGDLKHFFPDGRTVRMEWNGVWNPAAPAPDPASDGYRVNVRVRVNVE